MRYAIVATCLLVAFSLGVFTPNLARQASGSDCDANG